MISLIIVRNPLQPHLRETVELAYQPGKSLAKYLEENELKTGFIGSINGLVVDNLETVYPLDGDCLVAMPILGSGLKDVLRLAMTMMLGNLVGDALGLVKGEITGPGWFGKGNLMNYFAAGAVSYLGGRIINTLLPYDTPKLPSAEQSPNYGWNTGEVVVQQGNAVGRTYGTVHIKSPQLLAYYVNVQDDKQYLNMLLCGGEGPVDNITDITIEDNPVTNYKDVVIETRLGTNDQFSQDQSSNNQSFISNFGDTFATQQLSYELELVSYENWASHKAYKVNDLIQAEDKVFKCTAAGTSGGTEPAWPAAGTVLDGADVNWSYQSATWSTHQTEGNAGEGLELTLEFPGGLYYLNDKGKLQNATVRVAAEYRKVGDVDWLPWKSAQETTVTPGANNQGNGTVTGISAGPQAVDEIWTLTCTSTESSSESLGSYYDPQFSLAGSISGNVASGGFLTPHRLIKNDKINLTIVEGSKQFKAGDTFIINFVTGDYGFIAAKNTALRRTIRKDHIPPGRYEVRCKCTYKSGADTTRYGTRVMWSALSHILYEDFVRPNKVLVSVKALATDQLSGSMPSVKWTQTRNTVWAYNPRTGQYEAKRATSPAWATYDMYHQCFKLKNINTGQDEFVVEGMPADRLLYDEFAAGAAYDDEIIGTLQSVSGMNLQLDQQVTLLPGRIYTISIYCRATKKTMVKEIVSPTVETSADTWTVVSAFETLPAIGDPYTLSGEIPTAADGARRFYLDCLFDTAQTLWDATRIASLCGRGVAVPRGTKIGYTVDKPRIAVQLFSMGNIAKQSFKGHFIGKKDRASVVEVSYTNRDKNYESDTLAVYGSSYDAAATIDNPAKISRLGITRAKHAYREGQYALRQNERIGRTVDIEADIDAIVCQSGDVVLVQHDVPRWGSGGGRIVSATSTTVQLDRQVTLIPGQTYKIHIRLADDSLIVKAVVTPAIETTTDTVTLTTPLEILPAKYDLYAFGAIEAKPFVVSSMTRAGDLKVKLSLTEYDEAVYTDEPVPEIDYSTLSTETPEISNLAVEQETYRERDGTVISLLHVSWRPPAKPIKSYRLLYRRQSEAVWTLWNGATGDNGASIAGVASNETYLVKVCTVNGIGVVSVGVESSAIYITGKDKPPTNVPSLTTVIDPADRTKIILTWPAVTDIDLRGYQLREGATVLTPTPVSDTRYVYTAAESRTYTFSVIAVDNSGNSSEAPAVAAPLTVKVEPPDVTGFAADTLDTDRSQLVLSWQPVNAQDLSHYEIRQGNSGWDAAASDIIATQLKSTRYMHVLASDGSKTYMIKAVSVAGHYSAQATAAPPMQIKLGPDAPAGISAVQDPRDISFVTISWTASPGKDIAGYELKYNNGISTIDIDFTRETFYRWAPPGSGSYTLMIRAQTIAGKQSPYANKPVIIAIEPSDVTGFNAVQSDTDKRIFKFTWTGISDKDFAFYEIRKGIGNFADLDLVATQIGTTYYDYAATDEGTHTFAIKAVNRAGKYSLGVATATASISLTPSRPNSGSGVSDPSNRFKLTLSWDKVSDLDVDYYELSYAGSVIAKCKETMSIYTVDGGGTHSFAVRTKNHAGKYSSVLTINVSVVAEPGEVSSFTITQNPLDKTILDFAWSAVTDADLAYYEIREGSIWDSATPVASNLKTTSYSLKTSTSGAAAYLIKAVNAAGKASVDANSATLTVNLTPAKPASGSIVQDFMDKRVLVLSWTAVADTDFLEYEVRTGTVWISGTPVFKGKETSFRYAISVNGTYEFMVCAKSVGGSYSSPLALSIIASINPSNVSGLAFTQLPEDKRLFKATWTAISDKDLDSYEIRKGTDWSSATQVATGITGTSCIITITAEETATYLIKAKNKSGNYSTDQDAAVVTSSLVPSRPSSGGAVSNPQNRLQVNLSWDRVSDPDLDYYEVKYEAVEIAKTKETSMTYPVAASGTHTFTVRTKNLAGKYSSILTITATVAAEPADISTFTVTQNTLDRTMLDFEWTKVDDVDLSHYEIRRGSTWANSSLVVTGLKSTKYAEKTTQTGSVTYLVKAFTLGGAQSVEAQPATVTISLNPGKPATGSITQDPLDKSILVISWSAVSDADFLEYEVRSGTVWSTGTPVFTGKETSFRKVITDNGKYDYMVCAKNVGAYYSPPLELSITTTINPSDVAGFGGVQSISDHSKGRLYWDAIPDKDVAYYTVRKGPTWDNSIEVANNITSTSVDITIANELATTYWIVAVNKAKKLSLNPTPIPDLVFNLNPSNPSKPVITQDPNDRSVLNIRWTGIQELDLLEYELRVGSVWNDAEVIAKTKEVYATYRPPESGMYTFLLKAKNNAGYYSDEMSESFSAVLEPSDVTGFRVFQNGERLMFVWDVVADNDVVGYELREGSSYENGIAIASGITLSQYQLTVDTEITRRFHVKAVNRSGHYSQSAAAVNITITDLPPRNVIQTYDEIALQSGVHSGTEFGQSQFTFATLPGTFADYPTTKFSDIGGAEVLKLKNVSLIKDGNFALGTIGSEWIKSNASSSLALVNGVLRMTAPSAMTTGIYYDFPQALVNGAVYVVEYKARASRAMSLTGGFTGQNGAYAQANVTPSTGASDALTTAWKVFRREYTVGASGTDPGRYLFNYGSYSAGDWTELNWARIYKKTDEGLFLVGQWGGGYPLSASYLCARKDLGQLITANIATVFQPSILYTAGTTAALECRTSRDGTNWTDWAPFQPLEATFRYCDFRVVLSTADISSTPEVNQLSIRIDVPDKEIAKTVTVPVGGITVEYGRTFYDFPVVTPTAEGSNRRAAWSEKTKSSVFLQVFDAVTGVNTGGTVDLRVKGY